MTKRASSVPAHAGVEASPAPGYSRGALSNAQAQRMPAYAINAIPVMPLTGGGIVQPKLSVGHSDDPSEHEADNVADSIMSEASVLPTISHLPLGLARQPTEQEEEKEGLEQIQRQAVSEEEKEEGTKEGEAQLKCTECAAEADHVQREAVSGHEGPQSASRSFSQNMSGGQPLPESSLAFFGSRLGHDFSGVRVHANAEAARSARSIDARAYTLGYDIAFAPGEFRPGTRRGDRLLAHELAHVVQQRGQGLRRVQRQTIHMASGRFVGQIAGTQNNRREEVLAAMDRLNEVGAYTSPTDYQSERSAVDALPARRPVSPTLLAHTISAITNNDRSTLDPTAAQRMGLVISDSVGQGMANNKADILLLQNLLRHHFHLRPAAYQSEQAAVNRHADPNIPDSIIPDTIAAIVRLRQSYVSGTHTVRFRRQRRFAGVAHAQIGSPATWVPGGPGTTSPPISNTFEPWARWGPPRPSPPWTNATRLNCWEMILLVAFNSGFIRWQFINRLYTTGGAGAGWHASLPRRITSGPHVTYRVGNPNSPAPHRGQIVFFNGDAHVAVAEGRRNGAGQSLITSFWPPPGQDSFIGTADHVQLTTIEQLVRYMLDNAAQLAPTGRVNVTFANPRW